MFTRLSLLCLLTATVGACQSEPFCLNCGSEDLAPQHLDLAEPVDQAIPPDLSGLDFSVPPDLSQCQPSNGGVEACDGIDNDCNGTIDDVDPSKLTMDPQNCGACGNKCNFLAKHQFGDCMPDAVTNVPTCKPTTCLPGYYDLDHDPTNGCEYNCVVTGPEICDGQDNDCDGNIDKGLDSLGNPVDYGYPNYATSTSNCGACGNTCGVPGAVTACQAGPGGMGTCVVTSCINDGTDTYRHDPTNDAITGGINVTGCEYHCPNPATSSGDCNTDGACTFPAETCNGVDDDCNFQIDDGTLADIAGMTCYDTCPGGVPGPNCGGAAFCQPGTLACVNGAPTCTGGQAAMSEICDGIDNDCNGTIDDPFGYPSYNTDPNNCGGCYNAADNTTAKFSCTNGAPYANWNAVKGCHSDATIDASNKGVCYVVACNENAVGGYRHRTKQPSGNSCVATTTLRDGPTGTGCDYQCPKWPLLAQEICNAADDDCNGCVDDNLTVPEICSTLGACNTNKDCSGPCVSGTCPTIGGGSQACGGSRFTPTCTSGAWVCDYSKDRNGVAETVVDFDATSHALAGAETKCDQRDNNCNNVVDTDGFSLISYSTPVTCTDNQLGECRRSGTYVCGTPGSPAPVSCNLTSPVVVASPEVCDGKDNDCDGMIDETKASPGTNASYVVEQMVALTNPTTSATYYINKYEASRPDATSSSVGVSTARACGKPSVLPWSTLTETEAAAACAAAGLRLCTEDEWVRGCAGAAGNLFPYGNTYDGNKCNGEDWNPTCNPPDSFEQVQPTATAYGCPSPPASTQCVSADGLIDMSGNVKEWTSTLASNGTSYLVHGGAYDNIEDGMSCSFDFVSLPPTTKLATVGFRCCSDSAP